MNSYSDHSDSKVLNIFFREELLNFLSSWSLIWRDSKFFFCLYLFIDFGDFVNRGK